MRSIDHVRLEKLEVGSIAVASFEVAHLPNVVQLVKHEWTVWVAVAMNESEYLVAVLLL